MGRALQERCAVCSRRDRVQPYNMHFGVVIQLCDRHQARGFQADDGGRKFTRILSERWMAHGIMTRQRVKALAAHIHRIHAASQPKKLPGSHAWRPERTESEQRFAGGEPISSIIADIRNPARWGGRTPPSERTIRRWCADKRWLTPSPIRRAAAAVSDMALKALNFALAVGTIQTWHEWIETDDADPAGRIRFEHHLNPNPPRYTDP